jgi:DNA-binding LacI/PurR family transcriptional regulator
MEIYCNRRFQNISDSDPPQNYNEKRCKNGGSMISLKKIAKLCDVSESTVSKALKGNPKIKNSTRERIQEVARKYNYHPNAMVECIQTGRSKTIGIAYNKFSDMFAGDIMQQIHETLYRNGYDTLIVCWDLLVCEHASVLGKFSHKRVDGLLLFPMAQLPTPHYLKQLRCFHNPIVIIDQTWSNCEYDFVGSNDFDGAYKATEYMIECGFSKIGNVYYSAASSGTERRRGYKEAMHKHNLLVDEQWSLNVKECLDNSYDVIRKLLKTPNRPDALVCFNDNCAIDAMAAASDLNITVPDELSIIGFGDLPIAKKIRPRLTTMRQDTKKIGQQASLLLLNRISQIENNKGFLKKCFIPTKLVKRDSVLDKNTVKHLH